MTQKGKSVTLTLYSSPEGRYHWGGGCPYGQSLWGVRVRRLWCPGSEGSKGGGIALRAMSFIARLAGTGLHWRPPSTTSWSPSPRKRWEARLKGAVLSCYLPTPFPGVGGERSESEGGGCMGRSASRVPIVQRFWWRLRPSAYLRCEGSEVSKGSEGGGGC